MQNWRAMAVMARAQIAGRSKTRLRPPLSPDQAAALSRAFLSDITADVAVAAYNAQIDGWIAYAPSGAEAGLASWAALGTRLVLADRHDNIPQSVQGLGCCPDHEFGLA